MESVPYDEVLAQLLDDLHSTDPPLDHSGPSLHLELDPLLSSHSWPADASPSPAPLRANMLPIPEIALTSKKRKRESPPRTAYDSKKKKTERQPRVALVVKSKGDDFCDGYKWRKYGEKATKKNWYPRKYYRCANSKCEVKKRAERFANNPSILVVTYQGQHNHYDHMLVNGAEMAWLVDAPCHLNTTNVGCTTSHMGSLTPLSAVYDFKSMKVPNSSFVTHFSQP